MTPKSIQPGHTPLPQGIGAPAKRALAHAGVVTLEQVVQFGHTDLTKLHGMGVKTMAQLEDAMDEHGLEFPRRHTG
jgi:predicted flap endonuclease-1-like 5' DNA nuclease